MLILRNTMIAACCAAYTVLGAAADNPVLRIMPLGDSITHGSQSVRGNGYRAPLYVALTNLGYNVDYVGTQTDNYSKDDSDHEGHSGWKIENASNGIYDFIPEFFSQIDDPHVILLHIGTNDTGDGEPAFRSEATNRLVRLLDRIHECQPSAKVVVTTLMRRYTNAGDTEDNWKYAAITNVFNPAIPGIVADQQAKGQAAYFLDMHAAVSDWDQIADTVHPNDVGYTNMANAWVSAVTSIVPDPANFATENDLAVVQATTETVGENAFAINFTFNQKVTAATVTNAAIRRPAHGHARVPVRRILLARHGDGEAGRRTQRDGRQGAPRRRDAYDPRRVPAGRVPLRAAGGVQQLPPRLRPRHPDQG